jgi:BirA family biotin operon repressor/biotin-[acetyl-CoA-carboxylase] ligase
MILDRFRIKRKIGALSKKMSINIYKTISSTNTMAKRHAENGRVGSSIFIANEQTAGRGRLGRSFVSSMNKGLYLSILLSEKLPPEFATALTTYMAVIASRAISALTGLTPDIKWVNDLYLSGKKCAGILTEGALLPSGEYEYCIVGIGINTRGTQLHSEICDIATTLEMLGATVEREALIAKITELFFENLDTVGTPCVAEEYRRHSSVIGKTVTVIKPDCKYTALVTGITDRCELVLEYSGTVEILSTGEVSVRV